MLELADKNEIINMNLSGDEIANVNLLRWYRTCTSKYRKKENLLCWTGAGPIQRREPEACYVNNSLLI